MILNVGGFIGELIKSVDNALVALIAVIVIDYITGALVAVNDKHLSSKIGLKGISKKAVMLSLVLIGCVIDGYVIGEGKTVQSSLIYLYMSNEILSVLENATKLGLPVPNALKKLLAQWNEKSVKNE
jgi:toxin secretion/phage lysis holin